MAQIAFATPAQPAARLGGDPRRTTNVLSLPVARPGGSPRGTSPRAAAPAPTASAVRGPVRLTRRGRFLLIGLPVLLAATSALVLVGIFTAPVMAADSGASARVEAASVTVLEGETLWEIAAEFAPGRDPRVVIAEIAELNNLAGSTVIPGQTLFVPTGG